jgi:hypothetical protein
LAKWFRRRLRQESFEMKNRATTNYDVLLRRDALDAFIADSLPPDIRRWVSAALTSITGLAPTVGSGCPPWAGSVLRSVLYMLTTLVSGLLMIMLGAPIMKFLGGLAVVLAMRNFTSSIGHHLTHSTTQLPWPGKWTRTGYNLVSAILLLPSYDEYLDAHRRHHAKVAGPEDPDQQFIAYLHAHLNGFSPFLGTVLNPRFHLRFLHARARAAVMRGSLWRRAVAVASVIATFSLPLCSLVPLVVFSVLGYQTASLVS